ncbi:MAG: hypothetical protein WB992_23655 [Bryobacteraceae bacterium]
MMVSDSLRPSYEAVLRDLSIERSDVHKSVADLQRRLKELDYNIGSLSRRLGIVGTLPGMANSLNPLQASIAEVQQYGTVSTRWAILLELKKSTVPMSVQAIADALLAGGMRTKATNFNNNVSAVLSDMKNKNNEVDVIDGKWFLSEVGKSAADHIAYKLRRQSSRSERIEVPEI